MQQPVITCITFSKVASDSRERFWVGTSSGLTVIVVQVMTQNRRGTIISCARYFYLRYSTSLAVGDRPDNNYRLDAIKRPRYNHGTITINNGHNHTAI